MKSAYHHRLVRVSSAGVVFALLLGAARPADALIVATGPDDICPPTADPCVISEEVQVQPPGTLDFGLRTVHVTGAGKLVGTATITCGDFLVDIGTDNVAVDTREPDNVAGSFSVTAQRACSGDPAVACLSDATCQDAGLGLCSIGTGTISLGGKVVAQGNPGGLVVLRAAGDIVVDGDILNDGVPTGAVGGQLEIDSSMGSVTTNGALLSNANDKGTNYETYVGGVAGIYAAGDVTIGGPLDVGGGHNAGVVRIEADSVFVRNAIDASAGAGMKEGNGGRLEIRAATDIAFSGAAAGTTTIDLSGSSGGSSYGSPYVGYGGYVLLDAGSGDVAIAEPVVLSVNSGQNGSYGSPYGGYVQIYAGQRITVDGDILARGYSNVGTGGTIFLGGDYGVDIGSAATLNTRSKYGGAVRVYAGGTSRLDGTIDVRGKLKGAGYYSYEGEGGEAYLYGLTDMTIDGKVLQGAEISNPIDISVCRLRLEGNARIDNTLGSPDNGEDINIIVYESMYAAPGSRISADEAGGATIFIDYRDPNKPPRLFGQINPAPVLTANPTFRGCPICGNLEIDKGESCDDGNTVSGDGCRDDCQDEGCLAATPNWPDQALCDDGNGCTTDVCDPIAHQCVNTIACGDGVACTVDSCVDGACVHVPDDAYCDDHNSCTSNVCNAVTGCVRGELTGIPCEDGDPCTVTGTCNNGFCEVTDRSRASKSSLKFRFVEGPNNDKTVFKARVPLAELSSAPDVTGVSVDLLDRDNQSFFTATVPAAGFVDKKGTGEKFLFKDREGVTSGAGGIRLFLIRKITSKGIAKLKFKAEGTEQPSAANEFVMSAALLFGADPASDDCVTAWRMFCRPRPGKNKCKR